MPDDLFYPAVGVVACIMIFTAHVPHESDKHHESWFGYWKDDGFKKIKKEGRVPTARWSEIRKKWLTSYSNKEEIAGFSVRKKVNVNDEWCAEAFLETNYSDLKKEDFDLEVRKYLSFLVKNNEKLNF